MADDLTSLLRSIMSASSDPRDECERERIGLEFIRMLRGFGERHLGELATGWLSANYHKVLSTDFPLPPGAPIERPALERLEDRYVLERLRAELARAFAEGRAAGRAEMGGAAETGFTATFIRAIEDAQRRFRSGPMERRAAPTNGADVGSNNVVDLPVVQSRR